MVTIRTNETAARPIELSESDLEHLEAGAMAVASSAIKSVMVREDPCAGGQVTFFRR